VRHRNGIRDIALLIGVVLLAGFVAFEFTFVDNLSPEKRVEFEELIALADILVVAVSFAVFPDGAPYAIYRGLRVGTMSGGEEPRRELKFTETIS